MLNEISINLKGLKSSGLDTSSFLFLQLVFEGRKEDIKELELDAVLNLQYLQTLEYIKIIEERSEESGE